MAYQVPTSARDAERQRHHILAELLDPHTRAQLNRAGLTAGQRCLDIGCGGGSVAAMMAGCVGTSGEVLAVDINLALTDLFLANPPPQLTLREHNIEEGPPQTDHFDLVHARALLEHLINPAAGLRHMHQCLRPGGWLAISGSDWSLFDQQAMPAPFGEFMEQLRRLGNHQSDSHQRHFGSQLLPMLSDIGFEDTHAEGHVWLMRGGKPSTEWLILALEWAVPSLAQQGLIDEDLATRAIAQAREPDFAILSPVHIAATARRPA